MDSFVCVSAIEFLVLEPSLLRTLIPAFIIHERRVTNFPPGPRAAEPYLPVSCFFLGLAHPHLTFKLYNPQNCESVCEHPERSRGTSFPVDFTGKIPQRKAKSPEPIPPLTIHHSPVTAP